MTVGFEDGHRRRVTGKESQVVHDLLNQASHLLWRQTSRQSSPTVHVRSASCPDESRGLDRCQDGNFPSTVFVGLNLSQALPLDRTQHVYARP